MEKADSGSTNDGEDEEQNHLGIGSDHFLHAVWTNISKQSRTIKFWVELVAVIGGLFYAATTYFMWRDSHNNFLIDQQSSLTVVANFQRTAAEGTPIVSLVTISNNGKTAARIVKGMFAVELIRNNEPVNFKFTGPLTTQEIGILYPNSFQNFEVANMPDGSHTASITKEQSEDLQNGRRYIAVHGTGTYVDIFKKRHWFQMCAWHSYNDRAEYQARSCVEYNDGGDGDAPLP